MQEPFCSVPLVWIIQEDILANRLLQYEEMGWKHLVSHWKTTFSRANVIVFPDFTLPVNLISYAYTYMSYYHASFPTGVVLEILFLFSILFFLVSDVI